MATVHTALVLSAACAADLDALVAIRIAAMRESLGRIGRFDAVRARERLAAQFDPAATRFIEQAAERVGFVVVKTTADYVLLDHLYVLPAFQGQGIGSAVLQQLIAQYPQCEIRVTALRGSAANDFYLRHGFALIDASEWDLNYRYAPVVADFVRGIASNANE